MPASSINPIKVVVLICTLCISNESVVGQKRTDGPKVIQTETGEILVDNRIYESWSQYASSDFFRNHGMRCGTPSRAGLGRVAGGGPRDCTYTRTNPDEVYAPSVVRYRIPVVVHVIRRSDGVTGHISEEMVESQIDILNEDHLAIQGTNGAEGTNVQIEFYLATRDPDGHPTNGITYSNNTTWYNDQGRYWQTLAWDTSRYMNVYTNSAGGYLGYVPDLPQGEIAGESFDRVVVYWASFGRNGPIGPPYNQGRTLTHEVGHYLGLEHTFSGGCAGTANCNTNGDLICDTNPEAEPTFGCTNLLSCGSSDPIHNYMDYSDDLCMFEFTPEQARRMRCSLVYYRADLFDEMSLTCGTGADQECGPKNRYLSFERPVDPGVDTTHAALLVTLVDLPDFPSANGRQLWVGAPSEIREDHVRRAFLWAQLQCDPYLADWSNAFVLNVSGSAVVPGSTYEVRLVGPECIADGDESCMSDPITITTAKWGDVVAPFATEGQPNFTDISAEVEAFKRVSEAPSKTRVQLQPDSPNPANPISFSDIGKVVEGFKQVPYPFAGPAQCP